MLQIWKVAIFVKDCQKVRERERDQKGEEESVFKANETNSKIYE